ncbi:unnamed protein product, partial [Ectocarpus fasciculatus]
GGPEHGDLDSWRARIKPQQQQTPEHDRAKEEAAPVQHSPPSPQDTEAAETDIVHPRPSSPVMEEEDPDYSFGEQVASFAGLAALARGDREALDEIKELIKAPPIRAPPAGSVSPASEPIDKEKLEDLNRLAEMVTGLGDIYSSHMEDQGMQEREQGLSPAHKAYFNAVRDGVSNAYLAASVVGSNLVTTSKTGGIGTAGKALKLLSAAIPMVGGLGAIAAAALKTGDRYLQTRRVVKIADIARDPVECCSLARRLALRLADGLAVGATSMADTLAGTIGGTGGSEWSQGEYSLPDGARQDRDVMEWLADEVANFEPQDHHATKTTPEEQAGRRLGKKHLHTLLLAVGKGCLEGAKSVEEKVELLVRAVLPEDEGNAVSTPQVLMAHATSSTDSVLKPTDSAASLLVGRGSVESDASSVAALRGEIQSLRDSLEDSNAKQSKLENEVTTLKKQQGKSPPDSDGLVAIGGGLALQQRVIVTKKPEDFLEESQREAVAEDRQVSLREFMEYKELQDEKNRGMEYRIEDHEVQINRKQDRKR